MNEKHRLWSGPTGPVLYRNGYSQCHYYEAINELRASFFDRHTGGATENAGPVKYRTWKMTDQFAGLENAGPGK